jgi:hypothetical protein
MCSTFLSQYLLHDLIPCFAPGKFMLAQRSPWCRNLLMDTITSKNLRLSENAIITNGKKMRKIKNSENENSI